MPSLIVVHGVGDPSEADLKKAVCAIGAAFPDISDENRFFVNWNEAAADRIFDKEQFRWSSVERMFEALRSAIRIGWTSKRSDLRIAQLLNGAQRLFLALSQVCFAGAILAILLIPAFGIVSVGDSAFLLEASEIRSERDLLDPTAYWFVPAPLLNAVLARGLARSLMVVGIVAAFWLAVVVCILMLAVAECVYHRSTAPVRVAIRRIFLGLAGPVLILLLLPTYDLRPTVSLIAGVLAAPLVFIAGVFGFVVAVTLPFVFFQPSLFEPSLILITAQAFEYVVGIGIFAVVVIYLLARIRPGFGYVLKVLLDILLYAGDVRFRKDAHAAFEKEIGAARERLSDGHFVIAAHSLGSVIALESLLTSPQWNERDSILLVTMGSPIRRFFWRFFPDHAFPGSPGESSTVIARRVAQFRWINIYRPLDQIGTSLRFGRDSEALDQSTGQWNLVLSAHVNYWKDGTVFSLLKATQASAEPVRTTCGLRRIPVPVHHDTGAAMSGPAGPSWLIIGTALRVLPFAFVAVFLWMLAALWNGAGRVDEKFIAEQNVFQNGSDQLVSVIARARRVGGFEIIEGRRMPVTRTELYFNPSAQVEITLHSRKIGFFYRRDLFSFDAALDRAEEVCGREMVLPLMVKGCPSTDIEVRYEREDPHRFTLAAFQNQPGPSFLGRIWKGLICLIAAVVGCVLIFLNIWIALLAAGMGIGLSGRKNGAQS